MGVGAERTLAIGVLVSCAPVAPPAPPGQGFGGTPWQLVTFQGGDGS
jgi:hypothetical protein